MKIANVGHGLCMLYDSKKIIDCGSKNSKYAYNSLNRIFRLNCQESRENTFILSHFHADHYNGLEYMAKNQKKLNLTEVYFPGIPDFANTNNKINFKNELINEFITMNLYQTHVKTGHIYGDFLKIVERVSNSAFSFTPLYEGDNVDDLQIIWPPKTLKNVPENVKSAVAAFHEALSKDENLKKINDYVNNKNLSRNYLPDQGNVSADSFSELDLDYGKDKKINIPQTTKDAFEKLKDVVNSFSLSFYCEDRVLFLGDAENDDIPLILNKLPRTDFCVLITPHHGTHWDDSLKILKFQCTISSVGHLYENKYNANLEKLKKISEMQLSTLSNGDIICEADCKNCILAAKSLKQKLDMINEEILRLVELINRIS